MERSTGGIVSIDLHPHLARQIDIITSPLFLDIANLWLSHDNLCIVLFDHVENCVTSLYRNWHVTSQFALFFLFFLPFVKLKLDA